MVDHTTLTKYRVLLPFGMVEVLSDRPWPAFWHLMRSEGYIITNQGAYPASAIYGVEVIHNVPTDGNVIQLHEGTTK